MILLFMLTLLEVSPSGAFGVLAPIPRLGIILSLLDRDRSLQPQWSRLDRALTALFKCSTFKGQSQIILWADIKKTRQ
jgi:hypothetical protein